MMATSKVAFFLCFVFLGAESFEFSRLLRKRDPNVGGTADADTCKSQLNVCAAPLRRYAPVFMSPEQALIKFYQVEFLNGLCNDLQQMATCLQERAERSNCDEGDRQTINLIVSVVDVSCSDRGKQLILATEDSPCNRNLLKAEETMNSASFCLGTFFMGSEGTCEDVEQLTSCTRETLSSCGEPVVDLFDEIWPSFLRNAPQLASCQPTKRAYRGLLEEAFRGVPLVK